MASEKTGDGRLHELDLLRGLGCLAMAISHPLRIQISIEQAGGYPMPPLAQLLVLVIDIGAVVFFAAAGANVLTYSDKYLGRKDFPVTGFYLLTAAILYFMGFTYSLAVGTMHLGVPDIFQGIAMGTVWVFILLRLRAPTWVMFVFAFVIFNVSGGVHHWISPTEEGWNAIGPWLRFNFAHFSFFPWTGMVVMGAVLYRLKSPMWKTIFTVFFGGMFLFSIFFMPSRLYLDHYQMLFRATSSYTMRFLSATVLILMLVRHIYKGPKSYFFKLMEFTGRESFVFLVHHLAIVMVLIFWGRNWLNPWIRAGLVLVLTYSTLPLITWARDKLSKARWYIPVNMAVLAVSLGFGLYFMRKGYNFASMISSFPSAYAFALTYPSIRLLLRKRLTRKPATAA